MVGRSPPRALVAAVLASFGLPNAPLVRAVCPKLTNELPCSGHGDCDRTECQCWDGWFGVDCSQRLCPTGQEFTTLGMVESECSNRGTCDRRTGKCTCHTSWHGSACQRLKCGGEINKCNNRGFCESIYDYTLSMGHTYGDIWDAKQIYGCVCNPGFGGYDCSEYECPRGDDPLTSGQYTEVKVMQCTTDDEDAIFSVEYRRDKFTARGDWTVDDWERAFNHMLALTKVKVTFSDEEGMTCQSTPNNAIIVEFVQDFGNIDPLRVSYSFTDGGKVEVAEDGKVQAGRISRTASKENLPCSGRGLCDPTLGYCQCYVEPLPGYFSSDGYGNSGLRGDCGSPDWKIPQYHCPGEVACSGHGQCEGAPTYKCNCQYGWAGGDCSERTCESGWSWFPLEYDEFVSLTKLRALERPAYSLCSNRGLCDRVKGECICQAGFSGTACEKMNLCGDDPLLKCSGHGQCLSAKARGELHIERNPFNTSGIDNVDPWLIKHYGESIMSCECEPGYEGWDCSKKSCPRGDDPNTQGQNEEIQLFECQATEGSFRLSFRDQTTKNIPFDASVEEVQKSLEDLTTIEAINVEFSESGAAACQNATSGLQNVWSVTFITEYGDLPPIIPQVDPPEEELGYNCFSICYADIPFVQLTPQEEEMFAEIDLNATCAKGASFNDTEACHRDTCGVCDDPDTVCTVCTQPNELDPHEECGTGIVPFHYCANKTDVIQFRMITNRFEGAIGNFTINQKSRESLKSFYAPPGTCPDSLPWLYENVSWGVPTRIGFTDYVSYSVNYTASPILCRLPPSPEVLKTAEWWEEYYRQQALAREAMIGVNNTDDSTDEDVRSERFHGGCELRDENSVCGGENCGSCRLERLVVFEGDTTVVQPYYDQEDGGPQNALDGNSSTIFSHSGKVDAGFDVFPSSGHAVVNGLQFTSAGDFPESDPTSFSLEGSNDSGNSFVLLAGGSIPEFTSRFETTEWVWFENEEPFSMYRLLFPSIADSDLANSLQIADVRFWNRHPTFEGICFTCIQPNELDPHQPQCGDGPIPFHYCQYNDTNAPTSLPTSIPTASPSAATCVNGVMDGDETDVDCGGSCPACGLGGACLTSDDCALSMCDGTTSVCVTFAPTPVPTLPGCEDLPSNSGGVFFGGRGTLPGASSEVLYEQYTCAQFADYETTFSTESNLALWCLAYGDTDYSGEGTVNDKCCACGGGRAPTTSQEEEEFTSILDMYIIDNNDDAGVVINGQWASSTTNEEYWGDDYLHDLNFQKGYKTVVFTPDLVTEVTGVKEYFTVYVWYTAAVNRATRAMHAVEHANGRDEFFVNQEIHGGRWVQLGSFQFFSGIHGFVEIDNSGTTQDGYVIADAVMFRRGIHRSNIYFSVDDVSSTCGCACGTGGVFCQDITLSPTPSPAEVEVNNTLPFVRECPLPAPFKCKRNRNEFFVPGYINVAYNGQILGGLTSRKGSKENKECSNRGLCDHSTGQCQCLRDYSRSYLKRDESSKGEEFRIREDCGHRKSRFNAFG